MKNVLAHAMVVNLGIVQIVLAKIVVVLDVLVN